MASVELRELSAETVGPILRLQVAPEQAHFVAPNAVSIAQAYFEPKAWFRGVYPVGQESTEPVGFVMLSIDQAKPEFYLWRLMIADGHQRCGYGRAVIALACDQVRSFPGASELVTSYVPGTGSPEGFYKKLGFEDTGDIDDGEVVCRLKL